MDRLQHIFNPVHIYCRLVDICLFLHLNYKQSKTVATIIINKINNLLITILY
jgi:hypothetical protein